MKAVVINLDRDTERLKRTEAEFRKVGLEFRRFPAFLADAIPERYRERFVPPGSSGLLPAERGCFASHLGALESISRAPEDEMFLVCEDDIAFAEDFAKILACDFAKLGCDIVRLSENPKSPSFLVEVCSAPYKIVRYSRIPNLTGAYIVSPQGARKILSHAFGIDITFDDFLRRSWIMDLDTCGIVPAPVRQAEGGSSIDPDELRGRRKRRKYRCAGDSTTRRIMSRMALARQVGLLRAARYPLARARMTLSRTKRDTSGAYVID